MRSAFLVSLALCIPAPAIAADPKPDFTLTAEAYGKEFKDDAKAAQAKYKQKTIELTATIRWVQVDVTLSPELTLLGYRVKPDDVLSTDVGFAPNAKEAEKYQSLRALAPGQKVTVRGVQEDRGVPRLEAGEFVSVGASPAQPATLAAIRTVFANPKAKAKYADKPVVVRVKVSEAKIDGITARFKVTDPTGKGGDIDAVATCSINDAWKKELAAVKPGDTLLLLAVADDSGSTSFRLKDFTILKEPPAGVKLPGDKK